MPKRGTVVSLRKHQNRYKGKIKSLRGSEYHFEAPLGTDVRLNDYVEFTVTGPLPGLKVGAKLYRIRKDRRK